MILRSSPTLRSWRALLGWAFRNVPNGRHSRVNSGNPQKIDGVKRSIDGDRYLCWGIADSALAFTGPRGGSVRQTFSNRRLQGRFGPRPASSA